MDNLLAPAPDGERPGHHSVHSGRGNPRSHGRDS
jgi:hypothetical protein